jgi:hypothetical protein
MCRGSCQFCAEYLHVIFALNYWTRFALELCSRRSSLRPKSCLGRTLDKSFDACADKCVDDDAVTHKQEHAYGFEWVEAAIEMVSGEPALGSSPLWSVFDSANGRRVFRASNSQRTLSHQFAGLGSSDLCGQPFRLSIDIAATIFANFPAQIAS